MASNPTQEGKKTSHPPLLDLTIDNITPNVQRINSQCTNPRLIYLMDRLVVHLHDFARETRLSSEEWMATLNFLAGCGQICSDVRHEFILLSDVLGLSLLVDSINHPKPPSSTEGSVLGPFHTHDAPLLSNGSSISSDPAGEPMLVLCTVRDSAGRPLPNVCIDVWETDSTGHYDVQHAGREGASERAVLKSDSEGKFWFRAIKPVSYPIPNDGPVGKLLSMLGRHEWRPAHVHFMFELAGYDKLVTALYVKGDPYEESDAVFGVKQSLIVELGKCGLDEVEAYAGKLGEGVTVKEGDWLLRHDFVLASEKETIELRDKNAMEAMRKLGLGDRMRLVDHVPVPVEDLD